MPGKNNVRGNRARYKLTCAALLYFLIVGKAYHKETKK